MFSRLRRKEVWRRILLILGRCACRAGGCAGTRLGKRIGLAVPLVHISVSRLGDVVGSFGSLALPNPRELLYLSIPKKV
jgi:hypothetical protein